MLFKWHAHGFVNSSGLACQARVLKWHAQVTSWSCSLEFCISVPCPVPDVPRPHACLDLPSGI
ncbi:hypothetical protein AHAS_Ahas11G0137800 [Arachis hypogaea]